MLENAAEACNHERGAIKITTMDQPADAKKGRGVNIEIADNGAGIPEEILPKLFDFFVTTKTAGKGTGLGLVICQEIIKAHGGTIEIASQIGVGTTVKLYLPVENKFEPAPVIEEKP